MIWRPYKKIKELKDIIAWHEDANRRLDDANAFLMREKSRMTGALADCELRARIAEDELQSRGLS
jgi:hypothetical protein